LELHIVGMKTEIVTDGTLALERIAATSPDLVLLDTQLPGTNGIELAKIIRQLRRDLSLPIVFLSAESDPHLQLEARTQGGDDFIRKPVDRKALISLVALRAKRGIELRSLIEKDGLTGLLNFGRFMNRLSDELERCRRTGAEVTLAMVDLDHLKSINDLQGYLHGDRVIRALAHALTARLRRIDVVGRYEGDTFGVILLDTSPEIVSGVLDGIRQGFSDLAFEAHDQSFKATISAGLAGSRSYGSAEQLVAAANEALKGAKQGGRNRIGRAPASDGTLLAGNSAEFSEQAMSP
jgi:diguanylate cyclase (GGDEF)-like protein